MHIIVYGSLNIMEVRNWDEKRKLFCLKRSFSAPYFYPCSLLQQLCVIHSNSFEFWILSHAFVYPLTVHSLCQTSFSFDFFKETLPVNELSSDWVPATNRSFKELVGRAVCLKWDASFQFSSLKIYISIFTWPGQSVTFTLHSNKNLSAARFIIFTELWLWKEENCQFWKCMWGQSEAWRAFYL